MMALTWLIIAILVAVGCLALLYCFCSWNLACFGFSSTTSKATVGLPNSPSKKFCAQEHSYPSPYCSLFLNGRIVLLCTVKCYSVSSQPTLGCC